MIGWMPDDIVYAFSYHAQAYTSLRPPDEMPMLSGAVMSLQQASDSLMSTGAPKIPHVIAQNSQGECTPQWRVQNRFPHEYRVFPTRDHPRLLASIPPADVFPPQLERYLCCVVRQDADFLEATQCTRVHDVWI